MSGNEEDTALSVSPHLQGLLHVASLTNEELFPIVVAAIKRSGSTKQQKRNDKDDNTPSINWQVIAIRVAMAAAQGEVGCCCQEEWVARYQNIISSSSDNTDKVGKTLSFGEALKTLDSEDCCKKRLENALREISTLPPSTYSAQVSIRQVVGLIRTSTHLSKCDDSTVPLQVQALSCLLKLMPQIKSDAPCDIFLAVQLTILQKLNWEVFVGSGIKFATSESESEFRSLLNLDFDGMDNSIVHAGSKRKRNEEKPVPSGENTSHLNTMHYLLEAAHLARNGVVRAKHGAVIFIPSEGGTTKVIGKGWNHDFLLDRSKHQKNKINLHSEVHAVVDAIRNFGEDECFKKLFPLATIVIVELASDYAYETCHPCPKCDPLLRAVGIPKVIHTTPDGKNAELNLGPGNARLLKNDNVSVAFKAACSEQQVTCKRLESNT
ncbi:hypothetical protein HJC23_013086 [Cyclotella cryptica]|uniref:CMP/dCMP-type deaminase domain-containing protein n=1 Tax=Cyclotella cryptica TaxID=29204 RepID=A0ABD3Q674_9STRA|eukprot:CCRYP_008151-RA/>CCRYP_008151-RA protein AED:0.00 eAED:0.00 QI:652/-1/1/1/-1/1/1/45/435